MTINSSIVFILSCIVANFMTITSCNNIDNQAIVNRVTVDDIDKLDIDDTLFMSNIFANPRYISLESTEEALCGFIRGIRLSKNHIALNCDNGIFIFDKSGHFISKINNIGKGAFEYILALNIQFKNDSIIAVLDYDLEKIIEYNVSGMPLKEYQVDPFTGQFFYDKEGILYTAYSYPDYFSNNFYFAKNDRTGEKYIHYLPPIEINSESIRYMASTSLIDFYIDSDGSMEYWCFGLNKIFEHSNLNDTTIEWDIDITTKISNPITLEDELIYFFILHEGGILNFVYTSSSDILKTYKYKGEPELQMSIAFYNDLDDGIPFFPRYRCSGSTYANTLSYFTMYKLKNNEIYDIDYSNNPEVEYIFDNMEPNDNPIIYLADLKL